MAQTDYVVSDQNGASYLTDINAILLAIATGNSGDTAPSTTYAGLRWIDTSAGQIHPRNQADDAWIVEGTLDSQFMGLLSRAGGSMTGLLNLAAGADIASATTVDLTAATGNCPKVTGTTPVVAWTMNTGQQVKVIAAGALPLTYHATTNNIEGGGSYTCEAGDIINLVKGLDGVIRVRIDTQSGEPVVSMASLIANYISGLTLSTAGSSATMSIAAGVSADSTNSVMMTLASAISKTTSAWAVGTGNGGLDTGAIANNTWYHFYEIRRPDTGVVDVLFSLSASSPTLPTNYTQYRRIGSGLTNGSAQWVKFFQFNDEFWWDVPVDDISTQVQGTTPIDYALTVPPGVRVKAIGNPAYMSDGVYLYTPDFTGDTPTIGTTPTGPNMGASSSGGIIEIWTNTSSQIRADGQNTSRFIYWKTLGWKDYRGVNG